MRNVETVWLVAGVATSGNKGKAFEKKNGRKKDQAKRRREAEFEDKNKFEILIEEQEDSSDEKDEMFWQNDEDLYHEKKEAQEEFRLKAQVNKVEIIEIMNVTGEKMTRLAAMDFNRADVRQPLASAVDVVKCGNRIVMERHENDQMIGGYVENTVTKERMKLREQGGTFVYDVQLGNGEYCTITLDSGAGCNVWPMNKRVEGTPVRPKDPDLKMMAANGTEIENVGKQLVKFRGIDCSEASAGFAGRA